MARKIATSNVDPNGLAAYTACRLIALNKNPGVRPIGVGEAARRIIGKAILKVIKPDVLKVTGNLQLCAGQEAGAEAAVVPFFKMNQLMQPYLLMQAMRSTV